MEIGQDNNCPRLSATNRKRLKDIRFGTWNVKCQSYRTGGLRKLTDELKKPESMLLQYKKADTTKTPKIHALMDIPSSIAAIDENMYLVLPS